MPSQSNWRRFLRKITRNFFANETGNIGVIFGIALLPVMALSGAAVDYSQVISVRAGLQNAADSAVLAAASAVGKSLAERQTLANKVFAINSADAGGSYSLSKPDDEYIFSVDINVPTPFMGLLSQGEITVNITSKALMIKRVGELVLAIDTTGSMTFGTSWADAQSILLNAITELKDTQGDSGDLRVTLMPFTDRVNIGTDRSSWLTNTVGFTGCVEPREENLLGFPEGLTDKTPSQIKFDPSTVGYYRPVGDAYGNGLPRCPLELTGPTEDMDEIEDAITVLFPNGTGRFDTGMVWAWRLISENWSGLWGLYDYPKSTNEARKIVAFITDGLTEAYRYEAPNSPGGGNSVYGWNQGSEEGFENLVNVCDQMTAQGIEIHMIFVNGNNFAKPFIQQCASKEEYYYEVSSSQSFQEAISSISSRLVNLRITK